MKPFLTAMLVLGGIWAGTYLFGPAKVEAQSDFSYLYIEPGTTLIRDPNTGVQQQGKVMIDRRNGDIWGFPTASSAPYPVVQGPKEPPVSKPVYLGRFDLSAMRK